MRLVHHHQVIFGEIVQEARRSLARMSSRQVPRIILDAGAGPHLEQHLDVETGARFEALRLQQLPCSLQLEKALRQLGADGGHGALHRCPLRDEVTRRVDGALIEHRDRVAGERLDATDALDRVAPELDAVRLLHVRRKDLDGIAAHAEGALLEARIVAAVLDAHEVGQDGIASPLLAGLHGDHEPPVLDRVTEAVDGAHGGDDDHVTALHETGGCPQPQRLDVLVDRRILLDVDVGRRDVCLRLVVVVVRDEVLDRIVRKKLPELTVQLRRQRLVVRKDERRLAIVGEHVRQRHRLARARDAEKGLVPVAPEDTLRQLGDRLGLVTSGLKWGEYLEFLRSHWSKDNDSAFIR